MNVLITGHSRGLGAALAQACLADGHSVYGLARGALPQSSAALHQAHADFSAPEGVTAVLDGLVPPAERLDLAILNAGVLGPFDALTQIPLDALRGVMDVNLWANKVVLDWLAARRPAPGQVVTLSSGAAVRGNFGWGAYALSKAALNMLTQLYAHEMPDSHLVALAPGLVDTAMQDALRAQSAAKFPSLQRLHEAQGTPAMPTPEVAARRLLDLLPRLPEHPSGSFVDVRRAYPD